MKDKISKIDKLENSHKAQAIIKEAQSASVATKTSPQKKKPAKSTFAKPTPKNNSPLKPQKATQKKAEKAGKKANKKALKNAQKASAKSGQKSLTLGVITISADTKKLAKIETFFAKFIKNTKDKNEFIEAAIMRHIKKCKKKFKKN